MLDADALAVEGVVGVGDVAGGEYAGNAGLEALVDEDAVVDGEAGPLGQADARLYADTDDDEVALELRPSLVRTRSTALSPSNASTPVSINIRVPWSVWMSR